MCFFLPLTWRLYFFAILKKFVASTWIVIWKSIGRYGVHSYCCRPFQNQLHHHMVSQQLQIITIYHFPVDHQIQFNFGELVGKQFCNFSKDFMDKLCCSGIDNPPCHSMAEGRNGLMKLFPDHHDANDDGDARFSRITLVQCSWSFGFIAAVIYFLRKTSEDNERFSASLAFWNVKYKAGIKKRQNQY